MTPDPEILIVGAGPVGMTLALLLARRGHAVAIYERWGATFPLPRAVAMSHDSLRTFQSAGVLPALAPLLDLTPQDMTGEFWSATGEVLLRMTMPGLGESGFVAMAVFNQPEVDKALEACCLAEPRITLHRGWAATAVRQQGEVAELVLQPVDGDQPRAGAPLVVRGRFIVGCDGANSAVRDLMSTPVTDTGFSESWLVVDLLPSPELDAALKPGQVLDPARPASLAPSGRGRRRFEFMVMPGETREQMVQPDVIWPLVAKWGVTPDNAELVRHTIYTFRGLWADRWRDGRLLLAGDAAHLMPPFMGQGFNSGIRDAVALAWRLDLVLTGAAPIELLDTYDAERLPHVRAIVEQAVEYGRLICVTEPEAAVQRDTMLRAMLAANPDLGRTAPPPWRLGPGLQMPADPHAGHLALQAPVERAGLSGLLDDVIGAGHFVLLGRDHDPAATLGADARQAWDRLGGVSAEIGEGGLRDVDQAFTAWFAGLGATTVLVRPDFYVFGASNTPTAADDMVRELARQLGLTPAPQAAPAKA